MLCAGLPGEAAMAKYADYEVLGRYLAAQKKTLIPMTFSEVAKVVGRKLPNSSKYPAWWSNDPSNNPMTRVWLKAGFKTEQVDTTMQRLVFRRVSQEKSDGPRPGGEPGTVVTAGRPARKPSSDRPAISGFGDVVRSYETGEPKSSDPPPRCRHPLYGALKGYIRIMPGVDLTEPADPDWGNRVWGNDTK
jgi:hypothetical protein